MNVLITRPIAQAEKLGQFLQQHAINSFLLPTLAIAKPSNLQPLNAVMQLIDTAKIAIFNSPSTVESFFHYYPEQRFAQKLVIALGEGTASALEAQGVKNTIYPETANSEGVLALPVLKHIETTKITLFTGEEGRKLLADKLRERGAELSIAYTHQRICPHYDAVDYLAKDVDVSICTSMETLINFSKIIKQLSFEEILTKPLMVISANMIKKAEQLGFKSDIIMAESAASEQILIALQQHENGAKR